MGELRVYTRLEVFWQNDNCVAVFWAHTLLSTRDFVGSAARAANDCLR